MIVNEVVTGIIAVLIAYLLGSISSAYIITRLLTGKDIRQLGGGNAGARNVLREVGLIPALGVGIFDAGKGAASVAIAYHLMGVPLYEPNLFVLLAGLAVVTGHIWPVYLKFKGGNGLATTLGVLAAVMPRELFIVIALMIVLTLITHNPILSLNISLLSVPISGWFLEKSWLLVAFAIALLMIMVLNFIPTVRAALVRAGSSGNLVDEVLRRKKAEKEGR